MASVNKVILVGNVGSDPELRRTSAGEAALGLSLATNERWKDKSGEVQERTEWHRLSFFGRLAEIVAEYVKRGTKLYVEGRLRTRKWADQDGVERTSVEIIVSDVKILTPKQESEAPRPSGRAKVAPASELQDDIPF